MTLRKRTTRRNTSSPREAYLDSLRDLERLADRVDDARMRGSYLSDSGALATPGRQTKAYADAQSAYVAAQRRVRASKASWERSRGIAANPSRRRNGSRRASTVALPTHAGGTEIASGSDGTTWGRVFAETSHGKPYFYVVLYSEATGAEVSHKEFPWTLQGERRARAMLATATTKKNPARPIRKRTPRRRSRR